NLPSSSPDSSSSAGVTRPAPVRSPPPCSSSIPCSRPASRLPHDSSKHNFLDKCLAITRHRHPHQPANPALTYCVVTQQPARVRPLVYEPQPFFAITACSMSLSRLRSATSFRSRVFSSRNCFASCAWLTSIPPYFAFHAYSVCFDTPSSR